MKKLFLPTMLLLVVSSLAWSQKAGQPKVQQSSLEAEFSKLTADYNKAVQAYFAPYQKAKTDEEAAKIKLDPSKAPEKLFRPRFKAFAKKAGKNEVAASAWMQLFSISSDEPTSQSEAFEALVTGFPNSRVVSQLVSALEYSFWDLGDKRDAKIEECLARIDAVSSNADVKAAVLYTKAKVKYKDGQGDAKAARSLMDQLIASYPNSSYATKAKTDLFELDNLSVGCSAPDFEATDENGQKFKLSEYRGKVIVLDFWGFW